MIYMKVIGTPLFQWETGRKLQIIPLQNMRVDSVHFSNPGDLEALVVKPKEVNNMIVADIPNVLLQSGNNLVVYSVNVSSECVETLRDCVFPVRQRPKPNDYVYTETEVLNYSSLSKRIDNLEGEGLSKAVEDYLKENPPETGATKEEANQIQQNKTDIEKLSKDKLSTSDLNDAIDTALTQAKKSGEFDGADGKDGKDGTDGYTPVKGKDYFDGLPGKDGNNGNDGSDGITPHIGANGNWFIGDTDTGNPSRGESGKDGSDGYTPQKNIDYFDGKDGVDGKDGQDGYTPQKGVDYFDGQDGSPGAPGKDGSNGKDGTSATHSWNGTVLTITSASGTSSADLKGEPGKDGSDGHPGKDGSNGSDGVSPTVAVSKSGKVTTVSITDKNGTKTATINDGADGQDGKDGQNGNDGKDGTSVTVSNVSESSASGGTNTVTFSDGKKVNIKNGKDGSNGTNGTDGKTPVKGTDYFTAADKAEIVNAVIASLPVYNGEVL